MQFQTKTENKTDRSIGYLKNIRCIYFFITGGRHQHTNPHTFTGHVFCEQQIPQMNPAFAKERIQPQRYSRSLRIVNGGITLQGQCLFQQKRASLAAVGKQLWSDWAKEKSVIFHNGILSDLLRTQTEMISFYDLFMI